MATRTHLRAWSMVLPAACFVEETPSCAPHIFPKGRGTFCSDFLNLHSAPPGGFQFACAWQSFKPLTPHLPLSMGPDFQERQEAVPATNNSIKVFSAHQLCSFCFISDSPGNGDQIPLPATWPGASRDTLSSQLLCASHARNWLPPAIAPPSPWLPLFLSDSALLVILD